MGPFHQPIQPATAVEQGILSMQMKMNEVRVRHRPKLTAEVGGAQERGSESYSPSGRKFQIPIQRNIKLQAKTIPLAELDLGIWCVELCGQAVAKFCSKISERSPFDAAAATGASSHTRIGS